MAEGWREVRLFISSTFRDMQAERDHLVRFVFPRLREDLLKRRLHLVDVDLRWGVLADQDALDLCIEEIDNCRPRFICMLGGRYGWVPAPKEVDEGLMCSILEGRSSAGNALTPEELDALDVYILADGRYRLSEKPPAEADLEDWNDRRAAAVALFQRAGLPDVRDSITASEVFHGLGKPDEWFRYFYFRKERATDSVPEAFAKDFREEVGSFAANALDGIDGLKQRIRYRFEPFEYDCEWDDRAGRFRQDTLREFGARVYADLMASVDEEFGPAPERQPTAFEEEDAAADAFIEDRLDRYVVGSRKGMFEELWKHVAGSGGNGYLCVVGEPGSGKSALLGKFFRAYSAGTTDGDLLEGLWPHPSHSDDLVIAHFVGANATNVRDVLRRLCHTLAGAEEEEIPVDYDDLVKLFPQLLESAAAGRRVVILLDAINQLDPAHNAAGMTWLPPVLPDNARVILSVLSRPDEPTPTIEALRRRPDPPIEVKLLGLTTNDANAIIDKFLARFRKKLDEEQRGALLSKDEAKEGAGKPLYLLTALEELRTLGTYDEITERIRQMPGTAQPLFEWIFERLEGDEGFLDEDGQPVGGELVRRFCSFLSLGRSGMAEAELVDLSAPGDPQGNAAALRRLLRPYLMRRGELLDYYHGQAKDAARAKYVLDGDGRVERNLHHDLAEYFRGRADPEGDRAWSSYDRGLSELPYHLTESADPNDESDPKWQELFDILTDFRFLERKAADVGVVRDAEGNPTSYTGIFSIRDDYDLALRRMPGGERGGGVQRPIIVTAVDFGKGAGYQIRCPFCNRYSDLRDGWLGEPMPCPQAGCGKPLKVNPFKVPPDREKVAGSA